MPETYYYATGTEVTSIADAIREKGGTAEPLEFPDDFVQAIEDLHPEPTIVPLTVKSKERDTTTGTGFSALSYKNPIGYRLIDCIYVRDQPNTSTYTVDLSNFSNGETCYVIGMLYENEDGQGINETDMFGSFTWSGSTTYTKGVFTLTISSSSVTIYNSSGRGYTYAGSSSVGANLIGFCKKLDCDGFGPITVESVPSTTIVPLTVKPDKNQYTCPIGYKVIGVMRVADLSNNDGGPVDLSDFSNGDTCYVKGTLCTLRNGVYGNVTDITGSFIWSNSNTYTKGVFTLTITSSSVTINCSQLGAIYVYDSEIGSHLIGFCKKINGDGFGPITVERISSGFVDVANTTATAADIISGKTAGLANVAGTGYIATGSLVIQHYYTGSSTPSSSLGVNGDIYLKT